MPFCQLPSQRLPFGSSKMVMISISELFSSDVRSCTGSSRSWVELYCSSPTRVPTQMVPDWSSRVVHTLVFVRSYPAQGMRFNSIFRVSYRYSPSYMQLIHSRSWRSSITWFTVVMMRPFAFSTFSRRVKLLSVRSMMYTPSSVAMYSWLSCPSVIQ